MDDQTFERARASFTDGLQHLQAGALAQAEACFELALALVPGRPSALTNLGAVRVMLGRHAQAVAPLEQATRAEPDNLEAWAYLGIARARLGRDAPALAAFERALALQPDHAAVRFEIAAALGRLHRPAEALPHVDARLALLPDDADAWTMRGNLLRELGRAGEAAAAYERAIALGGDAALNRFFLAGTRGAASVPRPPDAYVRALFDGYAADFDAHLVGALHYTGHERVAALLQHTGRRLRAVLDLGCGTGLVAPLVAPFADRIDGIDLSPPMLDRARSRGLYTRLDAGDLVDVLASTAERYDAVAAADVFIYVGALDEVFAGVRRVTDPGALFAFSVERTDADGTVLLPSLRYAHGEICLRHLAARHGFAVRTVESGPIREDQRRPVEALYLLLQRQR
jgi:predicted TPR repeat methyltransferase